VKSRWLRPVIVLRRASLRTDGDGRDRVGRRVPVLPAQDQYGSLITRVRLGVTPSPWPSPRGERGRGRCRFARSAAYWNAGPVVSSRGGRRGVSAVAPSSAPPGRRRAARRPRFLALLGTKAEAGPANTGPTFHPLAEPNAVADALTHGDRD